MFDNVARVQLQRTFDDLGTPLSEVTFCVLDLETTGGSPAVDAITEVGALRVRRGEGDGTFHTLVDPGRPLPAFVRLLTGISDDLVAGAPTIEQVLPSLLEFLRHTVIVAHNARFDVSFLNASLERAGYDRLSNVVVDTARLARKILAGEVPNHKLETLSRRLRCAHQPCHRAFADVLATTDVLHHLIDRAAGFGATTLEDLVALSRTRMDGTFAKIALAVDVPRGGGIYRFIGASGRTLYVGKAGDLRTRVRSYFYGDARRRMRDLMREVQEIKTERCATMLEAEIGEARAIARERPPYNVRGKRAATWHVKISIGPKRAKVASARSVKDDGAVYVGPFSNATVRTLIDSLRDALPLHRCAEPARCRGCAFSEMGACVGVDQGAHRAVVRDVEAATKGDLDVVLVPLQRRLSRLASQGRFEEAAELRDRAGALERALVRRAEVAALAAAGEVVLRIRERVLVLRAGTLVAAFDHSHGRLPASELHVAGVPADGAVDPAVVCSWLRGGREPAELVSVEGTWAMPVSARPRARFEPRNSEAAPITRPR